MQVKQTTEQSVAIHDLSKAYDGYTLISPHFTTDVWLIDMKGRSRLLW